MKTILTAIFAIAVMVFVFNATDAFAGGEEKKKHCQIFTFDENQNRVCKTWIWVENDQIDNLRDTDQTGGESAVADSGNEGSTSAAQESDQ